MAPLIAWAKHGTGITTQDYWDCIKRPLYAGVLGAAAGWACKYASQSVLRPTSLLIVELTISFGTYTLLLLFAMGQKDMYVDLLRQVFHRGEPPLAET
jgi:hypothetical protein